MQHSRAITRKSASNLALAFILLPPEKRAAMLKWDKFVHTMLAKKRMKIAA